MSLVLGTTLIAGNSTCKYNETVVNAISNYVKGISSSVSSLSINLSDAQQLSSLSIINTNSLSIIDQINSLSTQIESLTSVVSELCTQLMERTTDIQFMDMNTVQKFEMLCVGPFIYENTVNGWYYTDSFSGRMTLIGDPENQYVVNGNANQLPVFYFQDKTFTPVKNGTKLCFPQTNFANSRSTQTLGANRFYFIPNMMDYDKVDELSTIHTDLQSINPTNANISATCKISLSQDEWKDINLRSGYMYFNIPLTFRRYADWQLHNNLIQFYIEIVTTSVKSNVKRIKVTLEKDESTKTINLKHIVQGVSNLNATAISNASIVIRLTRPYSDRNQWYYYQNTNSITSNIHIEPLAQGPIDVKCSQLNLVNVYSFDPLV